MRAWESNNDLPSSISSFVISNEVNTAIGSDERLSTATTVTGNSGEKARFGN